MILRFFFFFFFSSRRRHTRCSRDWSRRVLFRSDGSVAAGRQEPGRVNAVDAVLDDVGFFGGQAGFGSDNVADQLGVNELGIEVDGGAAVPLAVVGEVEAVIGRSPGAGAGAADTGVA